MVDISHVGEKTAADAMAVSRSPIIASHSTVKAVHDNPRGLTDAQLEAIRDGGGVAQITAYRSYIEEIDPRISAAMDIFGARLGLLRGPISARPRLKSWRNTRASRRASARRSTT